MKANITSLQLYTIIVAGVNRKLDTFLQGELLSVLVCNLYKLFSTESKASK
jgi:hypothetical protein